MKIYIKNWHWMTKTIIIVGFFIISYILFFDQSGRQSDIVGMVTNTYLSDSIGEMRPNVGIRDKPTPNLESLDDFSAMVERPLFSPNRRKTEIGTVIEEVWRPEPPRFPLVRFIGTIEEGDKIKALTDGPHGPRALSVGEHIEGWQVFIVEKRRMILMRGNEYLELQIFDRSS